MKTTADFKIGDEVLTLSIPAEKEAGYRTVEQKLDKLFHDYQKKCPGFSKERIYAITLFAYAIEKEGL